jgi:hypothetical protein
VTRFRHHRPDKHAVRVAHQGIASSEVAGRKRDLLTSPDRRYRILGDKRQRPLLRAPYRIHSGTATKATAINPTTSNKTVFPSDRRSSIALEATAA